MGFGDFPGEVGVVEVPKKRGKIEVFRKNS
jgi:hypothetical protein